jgi:OOP family OmpA-OmpF porin
MRHSALAKSLGSLLPCAAVLCVATSAHAQARVADTNGDGMDTHLFRPALDSKGFFTVDGADILGANDVSFGLVMDYGRNLMRLSDGHGADQLVAHSFQGTFGFNYGLFNVATIGLTAPVNLMSGDETNQIGPAGAEYDSGKLDVQNLSYVALHSKLRLLRPDKGFGVAIALQGGVPTSEGVARDLGSDPKPWFWPRLVLESRLGSSNALRIGANGGYRVHGGKSTRFDQLEEGEFESGNLLTGGFAVSYRAIDALDLVGETYMTQIASGNADAKQKLSAEAVGGIKLFVEHRSFLMLGAGTRYTPGFEAADLRLFIGFVFEPSIGDRDGDGYKDDEDQCPDEPEDFDGFKDEDGCPDPDNDNDGILDVDDKCPDVPEDFDGDEDEDGCPEGDDGDRDGDGILDKFDKCPDDPEDFDGFEDEDGCPDLDNDKDGILDKDDKCPNDPEDFDGFEDEDGCPDLDNDKDGIPDKLDKCPNEPETFNGFEDEDGCPDQGKVVIEDNEILILEKIMFETNSAKIRPESFELLDAVATTLNHHPEFKLLEVGGHADERSTDEHNLRLTRDRANSVRQALIQRNVDAGRLRATGYGEFCPLDPASNEQAWEKNRRVEFKVIKTDEGDTGVQTGCELSRQKGIQ